MPHIFRKGAALSVAALALFGFASSAQAQTTVPFYFDNTFDNFVTAPTVGSGSVSFTVDPGDGLFSFADLGNVSMTYTLGSETWTEANINTNTANVRVQLSSSSDGRRLQWSDVGPSGGGQFGGSLDLVNSNGVGLSFEPTGFNGNRNLYYSTNGFSGTYSNTITGGAADAPEPGSIALAFPALAGTLVVRRRRRRKG